MTSLGRQVAQSVILSEISYPLKKAVSLLLQQSYTNGVFPVRRSEQLILPCAGFQWLGKCTTFSDFSYDSNRSFGK